MSVSQRVVSGICSKFPNQGAGLTAADSRPREKENIVRQSARDVGGVVSAGRDVGDAQQRALSLLESLAKKM